MTVVHKGEKKPTVKSMIQTYDSWKPADKGRTLNLERPFVR